MASRLLAALLVDLLLLLSASCREAPTWRSAVEPDAPASPADATARAGDPGAPPEGSPFRHRVFINTLEAAERRISTGDYDVPGLRYVPIPVDPRYTRTLTFQLTPMLPPRLEALPSPGPVVLYSDDMEVLVFSPMDHFFITHIEVGEGELRPGVNGEVRELPEGFTHRFLLVEGKGMAATIERWGDLLLEDRGRARTDRYADVGLSRLGYWTDNGAHYYYRTEEGMNEEDTLLAVKADADARAIPYGYMQLDSWWYYKEPAAGLGSPGGLMRWEPIEEMFPDGLAAFHERLGLPLILHNRWFAPDNDYRADHEFIEGEGMVLPAGPEVFERFMADARSWGVVTYEQDWLVRQYWSMWQLRSQPGRAEQWMAHMHDSAVAEGLTMQLCMAAAPNLLDSLDRPGATTIRTSIDYANDLSKEAFWPQFHTVNMLAWAVGLLPFKDNFWSSEIHGEAEALVSALSAGMVGPGDQVGRASREILMRTCTEDGLLLKPDRPALPLDAMFLPHERPFLVATHSTHQGAGTWTYLAGFHLAREHEGYGYKDKAFTLVSYDGVDVGRMFVWPDAVSDWSVNLGTELAIEATVVAYNWRTGHVSEPGEVLDLAPFEDLYDFAYVVLAPVSVSGLALIGEPTKYVTAADKRFASIVPVSDGFDLELRGAPGEEVRLLVYDATAGRLLDPASVVVGADGKAASSLRR